MTRHRRHASLAPSLARPRRRPVSLAIGFAGVAALACSVAGTLPARAAGESVYTVAKFAIDATADDAVTAKAKGLADGEHRALRVVLKRIAPFGSQDRLPVVKPDMVDDMLVGFLVRSERNSATRYIASLDFEFRPEAVRQLLKGYGIPYSDEQAPIIKVLPVLVKNGQLQTGPRDFWRTAWLKLDLNHALAPVQLLQVTSRLDKETIDAVLAGDGAGYQALARHYATETLVLAVADMNDAERRLGTRLYGADAAGVIDLVRSDRIGQGGLDAAAERAAMVALRVFESRWKITHTPGGVDRGPGDSGQVAVRVAVEFAGMRQWQDIRARLAQVPGVQDLAIDALTARSANITFQYAGDADRLPERLAARSLSLENRGGMLVLRAN